MWVVIKKKRAKWFKKTKKEIFFSFRRRKERKGKENVCFLHPALFFTTSVYNDPTENEKKKITPKLCVSVLKTQNFNLFQSMVMFPFFNTAYLRE
jgi:hypothetical protein